MAKWRIAGINFEHMHMGDDLRMAFSHPNVDIVGVCDEHPERMATSIKNFSIPASQVYTDYRKCIEETRPDIVLLCPATAKHGEWTRKVAAHNVHILLEKPFAASLSEAREMISAISKGKRFAINWPLAWYPSHVTAKRIIDEGRIGTVLEVHYYDGNRGPLWHAADKVETLKEWAEAERPESWFYKKSHGGGSLLDYLGYGTTLGTWFHGGKAPIEITCMVDEPAGLEVDEHSITVARYEQGLSKFETRWGTYTDPWTHQPQPKCGFVIVGARGTISSYDMEKRVRVQTEQYPEGKDISVKALEAPYNNPVQYFVHCLENELPIEGPLSPEISLIGQQIVDTAILSAREKRTVPLLT